MTDQQLNKRYIVFAGSCYYPSGGMNDFVINTDDIEEAKKAAPKEDWLHVLDLHTGEIICDNR